MDQRFGVGLREELDAVSFELHSQFRRVLDDAVMHQRDGSRNVWVGVDIVWFAVGRPTGVADRWMTAQLLRKCRFELAQLSFLLDDLEFALRSHERNAGRVVAAVFNALKTLKEDWETVLGTDISDDAAHGVLAFEVRELFGARLQPYTILRSWRSVRCGGATTRETSSRLMRAQIAGFWSPAA